MKINILDRVVVEPGAANGILKFGRIGCERFSGRRSNSLIDS
jgi:hypothetical protein